MAHAVNSALHALTSPPHSSSSSSTIPVSSTPSNTTFVMSASSASPVLRRRSGKNEGYRPKIVTTVGAKPACLVNASVTYVGNDQIYAFGGFDQYTDEVYNHVLRLNLQTRQWNLVDNYGDIPGVRMGHTASLWQGNKLLVFGGENEHRTYLHDVIIFDLQTAHWTQPDINGTPPKGRARHSAVIHDDKLFILGGMSGSDNYVLDDICYLDLKTWTWSRTWRFVPRYDHTSWVWDGKIWVFGGLGEDMEKTSEIWWLDIRGSPAFEAAMAYGTSGRGALGRTRDSNSSSWRNTLTTGNTGYAANSSSVQTNPAHMSGNRPVFAPGAISSLKFVASQNLPTQALGTHFHVFTSGQLVDFVTPASVMASCDISLSTLDLDTLRWHKLADGKDMFPPNYRWHYCTLNEDGTHAWLLGCPTDPTNTGDATGEYLSDVLPIDLTKFGLLGNSLTHETRAEVHKLPSSDANENSPLSGIGADLVKVFDQPPETGSGADFQITAEREFEDEYDDDASVVAESSSAQESAPIHVHKMILQARWPHFARMYASQMLEFHTKKMHIPEPYNTVRAFLHYLYTDSIAPRSNNGPSLRDVAGMLVMSNIYVMPRLRILCVNRLHKELDVEHAAIIWERANVAGENWLKERAADFCMTYWGKIVRTKGFRSLPKRSLLELCDEVDDHGRVLSGEELEALGALAGIKYPGREGRKRGAGVLASDDIEEGENDEDEGMELS
ncbi:RING finger protein B [Lasiodiplodia hormozganensis]|uniref:RING finger protein B n=1 Tax=Lasiodiplodia hormozganensis TaxID=869390 RepID=A0AA39YLP4_9PEZI|nr:RING finger protein B [Lasiodiplodia hormozganensis]